MKKNKLEKIIKKFQSGFSVMEVIISIFIFSLVVMTSTAVFVSIFNDGKRIRRTNENMENIRTVFENFSKSVKISTYVHNNGGTEVRMFDNSRGLCIAYRIIGTNFQMGERLPTGIDPISRCVGGVYSYSTLIQNVTGGSFNLVTYTSTRAGKLTLRLTTTVGSEQQNFQNTVSFRHYEGVTY